MKYIYESTTKVRNVGENVLSNVRVISITCEEIEYFHHEDSYFSLGVIKPDEYIPPGDYSLEEVYEIVKEKEVIIKHVGKKSLGVGEVIETIKYEDWGGMIDELEEKGVVRTNESLSFLAKDPRVFTYGELTYEVDYLGTKLGKDISEKILLAWNELKRREENQ